MKYKRGVFRNLALVTQLGLQMMAPVFFCIFLGIMLDKYAGTHSILLFIILGFLAGGRNMYMLAKRSVEQEKKEDEEEQ